MVDYSKFDKLAAELSDSDDVPGNRPHVTRLEAGSRVVLGPSGAVIAGPAQEKAPTPARPAATAGFDYSRWDTVGAGESSEDDVYEYADEADGPAPEFVRPKPEAAAGSANPPTAEPGPTEPAGNTDAGVAPPAGPVAKPPSLLCRESELSRNGAVVGECFLWSQTAAEVTLSVIVPPETRARDVRVELVRRAAGERHSVLVTVHGHTVLDHQLAFPIAVPHPGADGGGMEVPGVSPDAAAAEDVDWAMEDVAPLPRPPGGDGAGAAGARRVVRITMRKAGVRGASDTGVVLWWNRCLADHPKERSIDTASLADRHAASQRTQQARKAWQDAESMFLERVKNPQRVVVD